MLEMGRLPFYGYQVTLMFSLRCGIGASLFKSAPSGMMLDMSGMPCYGLRERASFFLSFRHSVSQRPSSAVEDARSSAAHSFQRTRSIPHILWAGIPCQLILASRLYFRPGLLAI
ncbi:hypothetical protein NDU88_002674 [Pleurodeles waltl]|uniref:Uncharacterized protein n=1 Tax=Pleurodeles waltl TaxID=8319 RepID=A0AAV7REI0_PLEWA|nr:hypothetical protein NDU88_002674 [Pleurodeles waltl]